MSDTISGEPLEYGVTLLGGTSPARGGLTLDEARAVAKHMSEANAGKYFAYQIRATSGPGRGAPVATFVRGTECEPASYPRVELRQRTAIVAMIPIVDEDETWSRNAAGVLALRMSSHEIETYDADGKVRRS